jgi:hypothetical protein|tara:strand:+ start:1040 stop:1411 length:372 start_codon:yes stop_codon:yes gene_type:complete
MGARKRFVHSDEQLTFLFESWLEVEKPLVWTDAHIARLRSKLLVTTVREVADRRTSKAVVSEAWDWILSDEVHPFSFIVCCESVDLDPAKMREALVSLYRTLTRRELAVKVDLPALQQLASAS